MKTRTENWRGYSIRFVEIDGNWWAVLKDICDALNLSTWHVAQRLEPNMLEKVSIDVFNLGSNEVKYSDGRGHQKTRRMLIVNEIGIYEALFASRRLEARKFRIWAGSVLQRLRQNIGLKQYEIMRMTDPDIQDQINYMLDDIFYDPESDQLMCSVTVQGGDVDVRPFDEVYKEQE
jgi:prophage antirepressor-like protein|nr:MAG TPA: antirepressor [Bacteriophage sp.]